MTLTRTGSVRRVTAVLCALGTAVMLSASGCVGLTAPSGAVYHRDPSAVREQYDSWLLFAHLGGALLSVAGQDFDDAGDQLAAVEVMRAHLPPAIVELAARYVELCNQLSDTVRELFDSLDLAERLLSQNDLTRMEDVLSECHVLLHEAQELLGVLDDATTEAFVLLRRSDGGTVSQLNEARESLDAALTLLQQLTEEYQHRLNEVEEEIVAREQLQQPCLSVRLDRDFAWVGEEVTLSGLLGLEGSGLGQRELRVLLDETELKTVRTGAGGTFTCQFTLPFEYVPRRTVQVVFVPQGDDLDRFLPVAGAEMVLTVRFHESVVVSEIPARWHPGYPVLLSGAVVSTGNVARREIDFRWHGESIGGTITGPDGAFQCTVALPNNASPGSDALQLMVPQDDAAVTAPVRVQQTIDVTHVTPSVDVRVARVTVIPSLSASLPRQLLQGQFSTTITVEGTVRSALPLGTVAMTGVWGADSFRWEQQQGEFAQEVPVRLSIWSMGVRDLAVQVEPREPWHQSTEAHATLLVVNLFVPVAWGLAILAALMLALGSRRLWHGTPEIRWGVAATDMYGPAAISAITMSAAYAGPRLLLLRLYYRAVDLLQAALGLLLRPEMTLREYLDAIMHRVPSGLEGFSRLTELGERALYSRYGPAEADIQQGTEVLESLRLSDALRGAEDEEEPW